MPVHSTAACCDSDNRCAVGGPLIHTNTVSTSSGHYDDRGVRGICMW